MPTIQAKWDVVLSMVIPPQAPQVQRDEMKKAFYMGAQSMFDLLMVATDNPSEDTSVALLSGWEKELDTYFRTLLPEE